MAHFDGRRFKIHYVEEGKGPCVVFVHELGTDHTMYAPQFEDLPDAYRCIAFDMRGHGRSETPPAPWSMQDVVVDLIAFIEGTGAAPCHLVGTSWGGNVALRAAIQREDLVRSLVLIATSPDAEDPEWLQLYRGYESAIATNEGLSPDIARRSIPALYGEAFVQRMPEAVEIHIDRVTNMSVTALVESLRIVNDRDSVAHRLSEVHVPTLVIHGELDSAVGIGHAENLADGVASGELVRVPDSGHFPSIEAADVVNEALAGFFSRVRR